MKMPHFQAILKAMFSNLRRQVVTIDGGGLSPFFLRLIIVDYGLILLRNTVVSICLHYSIDGYFELDETSRRNFYQTPLRQKHIEYFLPVFSFFSWSLFSLLYLTPDRKVWSHMYDLLVRNRDQVQVQWRCCGWFKPKSGKHNKSWLFTDFSLSLKWSRSSTLLYYPNLTEALRARCIRVYFAVEMIFTVLLFFTFTVMFAECFSQLATGQFSAGQILFRAVEVPVAIVNIGMTYNILFLVMLTLYLVCHIYGDQYRRVNGKLAKVKATLSSSQSQHYISSSLKISLSARAFRTVHTRLTAFILQYNSSTVSKIISAYIYYMLPLHAYVSVLIYFQNSDMPFAFTVLLSMGMVIIWLNLMALNLVVARVNNDICRAGPILGAIFARKGVLDQGRRRRSILLNNTESIWSREALKLSTYYEMIWRSNKELAFTAGKTATMNWMFILDVSLKIERSSFILIFFCFYSYHFATQHLFYSSGESL